ncbi:MAG TPA: PBP1A family penicillin-binding protein, partial [Myxococcales bacterium]|nr:PBP1A family penicillin-binding protein [Myxococcales bacterium]
TGAFLAVEDRRFYQHRGIDFRRMLGALWRDLRTFSVREGSSTITMQLARNVFPQQIGPARTIRRKLWELVLAREIENKLPKDRILELYLNQIYLGNGLYGIEAASRGYFGKSVHDLTLAEAAVLAALPKAPTTYDPRRYPEVARRRRDLVLRLMADAGAITLEEMRKATREKLRLVPSEETAGAPWFIAAVRRELHDRFGAEADTMGLRVRTGLDTGLQKTAERELVRQIASLEKRRKQSCADDHAQCLEGLFVAVDPVSGDVRALVGGRDYAASEFDRATQAHRQPGSAFKPIVWAAALESGIPLSTLLAPDAGDYQPADRITMPVGPLNLREALRVSSNRAAVALGNRVGIARVVEEARALGITTPIPEYPSTVLGAAEVVPIELVAAYAAFGNGGMRITPRFMTSVEGRDGKVLWSPPVEMSTAIQPGVAYLMTSVLRDVVDRGTGTAARTEGASSVPLAGKTGTTNDSQDVWFVGGTPDLVGAVWLGYDKPRPLGPAASGGRLAAPVFGRILREYYRNRPAPEPWVQPPDLEDREIDVASGGLAIAGCPPDRVSRELFLPGTAPPDCTEHHGGVIGFFDRVSRWLGSH